MVSPDSDKSKYQVFVSCQKIIAQDHAFHSLLKETYAILPVVAHIFSKTLLVIRVFAKAAQRISIQALNNPISPIRLNFVFMIIK